jgi:hypothetical protein
MRPLRVYLALILLPLAGCSSLTVNAIHAPLYSSVAHTSTITANATDTQSGVAEIRINVLEGEITACEDVYVFPSILPCRKNMRSFFRACPFANVKTQVTCSFPLNEGDRRLISYQVTARNASGRTVSTQLITYAAGAPITEVTIHLPVIGSSTAHWETARPVYWHVAPSSTTSGDFISVGFFPDADISDYETFTAGLQNIAMNAFFNPTQQFAQTYTFWKERFDLFAGPPGANAEGCSRSFGGLADNVAGATDGEAILHQNAFGDCSGIQLRGSGSVQTTLGDAPWVFTHESGHFLHGLGDEYPAGGHASSSDPKNVYANESSCQTAASSLGINTSFCAEIGDKGVWRMDDGAETTMEDRSNSSDWRTASGIAVNRRLQKCSSNCY